MGIGKDPTSLKELFQGMIPDFSEVLRGRVISNNPLQIQVLGDDKLILRSNIICLPRHLSDYTTSCDITLGNGVGATIKIYNALKVGETVFILSFNKGKKYYILDREA